MVEEHDPEGVIAFLCTSGVVPSIGAFWSPRRDFTVPCLDW